MSVIIHLACNNRQAAGQQQMGRQVTCSYNDSTAWLQATVAGLDVHKLLKPNVSAKPSLQWQHICSSGGQLDSIPQSMSQRHKSMSVANPQGLQWTGQCTVLAKARTCVLSTQGNEKLPVCPTGVLQELWNQSLVWAGDLDIHCSTDFL